MADPFVAEIRIFAGNFAPTGWAKCDGQILPLSQNTALFSLLGTMYGGNGKSTFALPNLQDRAPLGQGQGQGLSEYFIGQEGGSETITLLQSEMPLHTHTISGAVDPGDTNVPTGNVITRAVGAAVYNATLTNSTQLSPQALTVQGSSFPHNNMQPYIALTFIIALQGVYPPHG
ncbi:MAG TPA: tail fiber protein [Saprospiraceae bacterium]|nr:tail fiber protein [Saprospiraceae bacterium]